MQVETLPTCHDLRKRIDLFLDGELEGRTMRALALHVTRCPSCEAELRQAEDLQDALADAVRSEVDRIDGVTLWESIAPRLEAPRGSSAPWARWDAWEGQGTWLVRATALAAGLALLLAAASLFQSAPPSAPERVASNQAQIDRLTSSSTAVAVWTEPREQTTAIWVASVEP